MLIFHQTNLKTIKIDSILQLQSANSLTNIFSHSINIFVKSIIN